MALAVRGARTATSTPLIYTTTVQNGLDDAPAVTEETPQTISSEPITAEDVHQDEAPQNMDVAPVPVETIVTPDETAVE